MCIVTHMGAFYYETEDCGSTPQNAEALSAWVFKRLEVLVGDNWQRVNSIITDTCATMRVVRKIFQCDPRTKHVFCVPCDSHGLQLLIKDLLNTDPYRTILARCQAIA